MGIRILIMFELGGELGIKRRSCYSESNQKSLCYTYNLDEMVRLNLENPSTPFGVHLQSHKCLLNRTGMKSKLCIRQLNQLLLPLGEQVNAHLDILITSGFFGQLQIVLIMAPF